MEAGRYTAKIFDYYATTSKAGTPQVKVVFQIQDTDEKVTAFLSLSGKASQYTLKSLIEMGMREANMEALEMGPVSGLLDMDTPLSITVEMREYNGKTIASVKWINKLGRTSEQRTALDAKAKQALSSLNGQFAMAMAQSGVVPTFNSDEQVPF